MTLDEIAKRIALHLRHFEADPTINVRSDGSGSRFCHAGAGRAGRYVKVVYVSYQGGTNLTQEEALRFLSWLDAGNVGRHFEAFR